MLHGGPQINQAVISNLINRHRGPGVGAVGRAGAGLQKGSYVGRVVDTSPHMDPWGNTSLRAILKVSEGPFAGEQISVHSRGPAADLLTRAVRSTKRICFDVFVRHYDDGRKFSTVNRETIRWAEAGDGERPALTAPGLPAHVRAMLAKGKARGGPGIGDLEELLASVGFGSAADQPPTAQEITRAAAEFQQGFVCIGAKNVTRKLIPWGEHYAALTACTDPSVLGRPVYLSLYTFTEDLATYVQNHEKPGSTAGYRGVTYSPLIVFDIDRKNDLGRPDPLRAYRDTAKLLVVLLELGIPDNCLRVSFSGSKGFHVEFPSMLAGATPSVDFPGAEKAFCSMIAAEAGVEIDTSIYETLHSLRAPNSRHEESRLYKVSMTTAEFLDLVLQEILILAAQPRAYAPPAFVCEPSSVLWELWKHAEQKAHHVTQRRERDTCAAGGDARIWEATWQFLINGAPDGERAVAIFKAASNLAHFESVDDLIRALLSRGVMLCGMPPGEAAGHIDSALRRAAEARLLGQIEFPPEP